MSVAGGEGGEGEGKVGENRGEGLENEAACLGRSVGCHCQSSRGKRTGMTSRPMPSPGRRPMRRDREAIGAIGVVQLRSWRASEAESYEGLGRNKILALPWPGRGAVPGKWKRDP